MVHTFECGPSGYGFLYEDYDYFADEFSEQYLYEFDFSFIQCYTIRKLNSRNQGYLPTFSVHFTNLSTIADPIQRRQSESMRSIAGSHKHLHRL
jgi:hypothetical protein